MAEVGQEIAPLKLQNNAQVRINSSTPASATDMATGVASVRSLHRPVEGLRSTGLGYRIPFVGATMAFDGNFG